MSIKKWVLPFTIILALSLVFLGGCLGTGFRVAVVVRGVVANPEGDTLCYIDFEENPQISEGVPLSNADLLIIGDEGTRITTETDEKGEYRFTGKAGEAYVIYAYKGNIIVKKGIATLTPNSQEAGEANYYTTSQVIIYEVAERLYPGAVEIADIPFLEPTDEIVQAVKNVLANCEDAQGDPQVIALVEALVNNLFGEPGTPGIPPVVTNGENGGENGGNGETPGNGEEEPPEPPEVPEVPSPPSPPSPPPPPSPPVPSFPDCPTCG